MKPKITLKVGASFSKASLGHSDWEWKLEEYASSAESRSSADQDSTSGKESSASSEDGNSSSSSSSSSSSTSSFGVEVVPKKKAVPGKGTKRSWESANKGGQNRKWLPHPCLLRGPKEGRNATSPLHSRGSLAKGTKSKVAALRARTKLWMCSPKEYHQKFFHRNGVSASKSTLKNPPQTIFKKGGVSNPPPPAIRFLNPPGRWGVHLQDNFPDRGF